jgi:hypothetical protein
MDQSNRAIAIEAITDLGRKFAAYFAVSAILWLAILKVMEWFPAVPHAVPLATGIATAGANVTLRFLRIRRHA